MLPSAQVREHFNIAGLSTKQIQPFTDKVIMKTLLQKNNIRMPKHIKYDNVLFKKNRDQFIKTIIKEIKLPLVAKPNDESNSRNITIVNSEDELTKWCLDNSIKQNMFFEEFVSGTLFFCDSIVINNEIRTLLISEYINPPINFSKGKPHGSITIPKNSEIYNKISEFNNSVISALGKIHNCVHHLEIFYNNEYEYVFLEIAARAPGAYVNKISEIYINTNLEKLNFQMQIGMNINHNYNGATYAAWVWFPKKAGKVISKQNPKITSKSNIIWNTKEGEILDDIKPGEPNSANNACCIIVLENDNYTS